MVRDPRHKWLSIAHQWQRPLPGLRGTRESTPGPSGFRRRRHHSRRHFYMDYTRSCCHLGTDPKRLESALFCSAEPLHNAVTPLGPHLILTPTHRHPTTRKPTLDTVSQCQQRFLYKDSRAVYIVLLRNGSGYYIRLQTNFICNQVPLDPLFHYSHICIFCLFQY
jgi:hypothetical protein